MSALDALVLPSPRAHARVARRENLARVRAWAVSHARGGAVLGPVLVVTGVVHLIGSAGWPAFDNDDEGTYMARAWAVLTGRGAHHSLAQYTYWYDHPPLGWMQLAAWAGVAHVFRASTTSTAVMAGRELMGVYALVSTALVYMVARRLRCSIFAAGIAALLFSLSPLALYYLRRVYLDSIGLPWLLAAFALALSPRRRLWSFAASGACFAIAALSKETFVILAPPLFWQAYQNAEARTRRMCMWALVLVACSILAYFPLYAMLKGELIPGRGHVSLIGAIEWQLAQRRGSGSVFSPSSASHALVSKWLEFDPWLVAGGYCAVPLAVFVRRLRPVALALVILGATVLRHGYLPDAFVTAVLPFAAVLPCATLEAAGRGAWRRIEPLLRRRGVRSPQRWRTGWFALIAAAAGALVAQFAPTWSSADASAMSAHQGTNLLRAENWIAAHLPHSAVLMTDDDTWIDLVDRGFAPNRVVWQYQLDTDPQVERRFPGRWRDMDYVISTPAFRGSLSGDGGAMPSAVAAVSHSHVVATFGPGNLGDGVVVLKVDHPSAPAAGIPLRHGHAG